MININFKQCCQECLNIEVTNEVSRAFSNNRIVQASVDIGCSHNKVCKEFIDSVDREGDKP